MPSTVAACLVTRESSNRLAWWCTRVRQWADEIVIAIDTTSTDDTYAVAREHADRVYLVEVFGNAAQARDWLHRRAGTDWILVLDDDETLPDNAPDLLPALLNDRGANGWELPLRTVTANGDGLGWIPATEMRQLRLWRNLGGTHFYDPADRLAPTVVGRCLPVPLDRPLAVYQLGPLWSKRQEEGRDAARTPVNLEVPRQLGLPRRRRAALPDDSVVSTEQLASHLQRLRPATPPWSAAYRLVEAPQSVRTNCGALAWITVTNTSDALWPSYGLRPGRIVIGTRWSTPGFGDEIPMGGITLLPHPVEPGEEVLIEAGLWTPRIPGNYRVTLELLREGDSWFSQHGVPPLTLEMPVHAGDAPLDVRHFVGRLPDDPDRDPASPMPSWLVTRPSIRLLDTRSDPGLPDGLRGPIPQDGLLVLRLAGVAGTPADASGLTVTVTVVDADYDGWLAVFPTDGSSGEAFPAVQFAGDGRPVTATVTVPFGVGRGHGKVSFHLAPGPPGTSAHLVVDTSAYLVAAK